MIVFAQDGTAAGIDIAGLAKGPKSSSIDNSSVLFKSFNLRIDNRAQLGQSLRLGPDICDTDLILAGWRQWGESLADRIDGSFAFAIHDPATRSLYLARDIFGLSPLFYAEVDGRFFVGGGSRAIRRIAQHSFSNDTMMLTDFISGATLENELTFFQGIRRLPPASWMRKSVKETVQTQYWSVDTIARDQTYRQPNKTFRSLFDDAVSDCHVAKKTALQLSGGLDSSAIAGSLIASDPNTATIPTFSLTYDNTPNWCDGQHLAAIAKQTRILPKEVPSDAHKPLDDIDHWLTVTDGPYLPVGFSVSTRLLWLAKEDGCDYMLSGHGGDEVVSYGFGRLNELSQQGRWWTLWKELEGAASLYGDSRASIFLNYLSRIDIIKRIRRRFERSARVPQVVSAAFVSDEALSQIAIDRYDYSSPATRRNHDERMLHEAALTSALQPLSLEVYALCGEASGVELRFPFYNRALVEFSLSLTSDWKLRNGYTRYILREAMRNDIPDTLRLRRDKFDFGKSFMAGLYRDREKVLDLTVPSHEGFKSFVNRTTLEDARNAFAKKGIDTDIVQAFFLWRCAVLALWFDILRDDISNAHAPVLREVP